MQIKISQHNISTESGCKKLLEEANCLGPVTSIFHLAVVLLDAFLENQTEESFRKSFSPKAKAAQFLDAHSRRLCPHLR